MHTLNSEIQSEIARRQKASARTVIALMIAAVLLSVIAFLGRNYFNQRLSFGMDMTVRITILVFGLGAIALRRTKFNAIRLQDIGGLQGTSGLLKALEQTTLQLAILGALIVVVGFVGTVLMGNEFYTYVGALISIVVLLYSYPTKSSWIRTILRFAPSN
ncbi:MAG TPA: hypothetical protein VI306_03745 [Pyrinomonadaceae bacterium]